MSSRRRCVFSDRVRELFERERHALGRIEVLDTRSRTNACVAAAPAPSSRPPRRSIACAATTSSIATRRAARPSISSRRRPPSELSDIRSSTPDSCIVEASSIETGCASSLASAAIACAATPSSESPSCHDPSAATRPSVRPLNRGLRSFSVRSTAAVSTGASARRARSSAVASACESKFPTETSSLLVRNDQRVPLVRVELDGDLALHEGECVASGAVYLRDTAEAQRVLEEAGALVGVEAAPFEQCVDARQRLGEHRSIVGRPRSRDGARRRFRGTPRSRVPQPRPPSRATSERRRSRGQPVPSRTRCRSTVRAPRRPRARGRRAPRARDRRSVRGPTGRPSRVS